MKIYLDFLQKFRFFSNFFFVNCFFAKEKSLFTAVFVFGLCLGFFIIVGVFFFGRAIFL